MPSHRATLVMSKWTALRSQALWFVCGLSLMGAACQTQIPPVKINNKQYKPKAKEYRHRLDAHVARKRGDQKAERKAWVKLLEQHPQSPFRREAHRRLGWLSFVQSQWRRAIEHLQKAEPNTMSQGRERTLSLWAYGVSLYRIKQYAEASNVLEGIYKSLPSARQRRARVMMLKAAQKTGNVASEIRWLAAQLKELPTEKQREVRAQLKKKIDGQLSLAKLYKVYLQRGEKLAFPFTLMALRLARSYCHVRDWARCRSLTQQLLSEIPPTHTLFPMARKLQAHLLSIRGKVSPRVLGVIYPKTGRGAGIGRWVRNAIYLAKRRYPNVQIRVMDSRSDPTVAAKAVETLVFRHQAIAILGPPFSSSAMAAALQAQRLGVPMLTIAIRESIPKVGPFIFRNNLTLSRMGRSMARYAVQQLGHRRLAVMFPNRSSGRIQTAAFWKEVERLGGRVVGAEAYDPGISDFTDAAKRLVGRYHLTKRPTWYKLYRQIRHIRNPTQKKRLYKKLKKQFLPVTDFDAVFIPAEHYLQVAMIASSLAQQDVEVKLHYRYWEKQREELYKKRHRPLKFIQLLGTNVWKNERIFSLEARNIIGSIFPVRYFPKSKRQIVRRFVNDYKSSFPGQTRDRDPIHVSAYVYDSMQLLLHVAGGKTPPTTRDAFRRALLRVSQFPGVTGNMSVQASGEVLAPIRYLIADRKQYFRLNYVSKQLIP